MRVLHNSEKRLIPSTVLLSAIHFKGIENGPSMEFVLDAEGLFLIKDSIYKRERNGEMQTEDENRAANWALLLAQLGIVSADEYERLLFTYLNSGLMNHTELDAIIIRYLKDHQFSAAQKRSSSFFQTTNWDPELPKEKIKELAHELLDDVPYFDCYTITAIHDRLIKLDCGQLLAEKFVQSFIAIVKSKAAEPEAESSQFQIDNWGNQPLHPTIAEAFEMARNSLTKPASLFETCIYLVEHNGWNASQKRVMQAATVDEFERTILELRGENLQIFMLKNLEIYVDRESYAQCFGQAPLHFLEACKRIYKQRAGTRWSSLIKDAFVGCKVGADLEDIEKKETEKDGLNCA